MTSLTALMFVVWFAFILAVVRIKPLSDALVGTNEDTGNSHPWVYRLLGGIVIFPMYGLFLFGLGWVAWKLGGLMLLPVQYLYNLLPTT